MTRTTTFLGASAVLLAALAGLLGCQTKDLDVVLLVREPTDTSGPATYRWSAQGEVYISDARGKYQLLAEAPPTKPVIQQRLYVRLMWNIAPAETGTDPTAMNAHVGYLVRTDPSQPDCSVLYYEGVGNVFIDQPNWLGGKTRFTIRHALLRLTKSNRDRTVDPYGIVELSGEVTAGADPAAGQKIAEFLQIIDPLPAPSEPSALPATRPPEAPATAPDDELLRELALPMSPTTRPNPATAPE